MFCFFNLLIFFQKIFLIIICTHCIIYVFCGTLRLVIFSSSDCPIVCIDIMLFKFLQLYRLYHLTDSCIRCYNYGMSIFFCQIKGFVCQ